MKYRGYGRGPEQLSVVGLGSEYMLELTGDELVDLFDAALDSGVNILDLFMPQPELHRAIGRALRGRRDKMMIQGHLCSTFQNGQYQRDRDRKKARQAFEDLLRELGTDYIDFGMIHYVDKREDYDAVLGDGVMDLARELKARGLIRHIGVSSHNPVVAGQFVRTGEVDLCLFSINPAYDMDSQNNEDLDGLFAFTPFAGQQKVAVSGERAGFFALCQREGVGITVMKALAGGRLLRDGDSPFGRALSVPQCVQYALDRPGVLSCLIGVKNIAELREALRWVDASQEERDYLPVISGRMANLDGRCMYCNHCLPCPAEIDVAAVNRFLDLATAGGAVPESVRSHYFSLPRRADDCIGCASCEQNCPFGVPVRERMERAKAVFGTPST